ncbi:hypothetical protein BDN67DRAFT_962182 [Paxillus ammoniavirescens]|nr:hypothetical protein BDN67DRAFT_962182 [Paxillus ammoniavirescens]
MPLACSSINQSNDGDAGSLSEFLATDITGANRHHPGTFLSVTPWASSIRRLNLPARTKSEPFDFCAAHQYSLRIIEPRLPAQIVGSNETSCSIHVRPRINPVVKCYVASMNQDNINWGRLLVQSSPTPTRQNRLIGIRLYRSLIRGGSKQILAISDHENRSERA